MLNLIQHLLIFQFNRFPACPAGRRNKFGMTVTYDFLANVRRVTEIYPSLPRKLNREDLMSLSNS